MITGAFIASSTTTHVGNKQYPGRLTGFVLHACFILTLTALLIGHAFGASGKLNTILVIPLYLSELFPSRYNGGFVFGFQLMITFGVLCTNLANIGVNKISDETNWHWNSCSLAVPALVIYAGTIFLPREPSLFITWDEIKEAKLELQYIRGTDNIVEEFNDLLGVNRLILEGSQTWKTILKKRYRPHLIIALVLPIFQQFTGINVIILYGPIISKGLGFGTNASLTFAVMTAGIILVGTIMAITLAKTVRRKLLLKLGGALMSMCQIVAGYKIGANGEANSSDFYTNCLLALLCLYLFAFACSWGVLGCLVPSEIFPLEIRSTGHSIMVGVSMLFTFIIAQFFLGTLCKFEYVVFYFFSGFVLIMTIFVIYFLPETKDIPIDDMPNVWRRHWFWKKYLTDERSELV
ncbi:hypothetical protein IFM89_018116 [Coptis chinensis]|uniref:Major facilitator superfamily (MFS) profile domain-containing protein n=1 Tax=Coptis chinensis TaxID=261450 RepID=A0A835HRM3_9MAGN|nr:hypothetical protein IFM89_018116 [Coptis chinensis]